MTEWQRVADLVSSVRTIDFSQRLAAFLKTELHCDQLCCWAAEQISIRFICMTA